MAEFLISHGFVHDTENPRSFVYSNLPRPRQINFRQPCVILVKIAEYSLENVVAVARARAAYEVCDDRSCAPEIGGAASSPEVALRPLFRTWHMDPEHYGTSAWNPLAALISAGSRIVIKPNWVFHENQRDAGLDCLLTHSSIIEVVAK